LRQSKFEGFTLYRDVNQERVNTVLVMVAHYNCPVEDAHKWLTNITSRESVIRNQWGDRIQNYKFLDVLRDC